MKKFLPNLNKTVGIMGLAGEGLEIQIRKFSMSDLPRLVQIESASFSAVDAWSEPIFQKWHRRSPEFFIIAELTGDIAGYMCTSIENNTGEIQSIAVAPAFRRRKVASRLLEYTLKEMRAAGVTAVELQVRVINAGGILFWQKAGFKGAGFRLDIYENGGKALQMEKALAVNSYEEENTRDN